MDNELSEDGDGRVSTISSVDMYHGNQILHRNSAWPLSEREISNCDIPVSKVTVKPKKYQLLRIIAVISLPFGILIPLAVFYFTDAVSMTRSEARLRDIMEERLSRTLVNFLQTERFYACLYLTTSNQVNISTLVQSIIDTDTVLNHDIGSEQAITIVDKYQYSLLKLRQRVISGEIVAHECSEQYSRMIESIITDLITDISAVTAGQFSQAVAAYYYFLRYEEQFSIMTVIGGLKFLNLIPYQDQYYFDRLHQCIRGSVFLEMSLRYSNTVEGAYRISVETNKQLHLSFDMLKDILLGRRTTNRSKVHLYSEWLNVTNLISSGLNEILHDTEEHLVKQINIDLSSSQIYTAIFSLLLSFFVCVTPIIFSVFIGMTSKALNLSEDLRNQVHELACERKRADTLLYQMLPKDVAEQLKQSNDISAVTFDSVTIYFSEVDNFLKICSESTPIEVILMLNTLYRVLDSKVDEYDAYKVETINDAYMLASGLPKRNGNRHVYEICSLAIELRDHGEELTIPHRQGEKFKLRIGINTGPCAAGIVGSILPRYCLFGDTINTASRMESTSFASKIHMSPDTFEALKEFIDEFHVESRGVICVKGKGEMHTYWLLGKQPSGAAQPPSMEINDDKHGIS